MERQVPIAYTVAEMGGRYYPLRFGLFRLDSQDERISFGRRADAEAYCRNEQREYARAYPSAADGR